MKTKIALIALTLTFTTTTFAAWDEYENLDGCVLKYVHYYKSRPESLSYINLSSIDKVEDSFNSGDELTLGPVRLTKLDSKTKKMLIDKWLTCVK